MKLIKNLQNSEPSLSSVDEFQVVAIANNRGMTIVEIMVVMTILASLMGAIGFFAFGALDRAGDQEAAIYVKKLTENVESYYITSSPRKLPSSLTDLAEGSSKLMEKVEKDPWGNDYIYTKSGARDFEIRSAGKDGIPETGDDICESGPCNGVDAE